jgi:hypothetical protein
VPSGISSPILGSLGFWVIAFLVTCACPNLGPALAYENYAPLTDGPAVIPIRTNDSTNIVSPMGVRKEW